MHPPEKHRMNKETSKQEERLAQQLKFILTADELKNIQRQNLLVDGSRRENSAEHSWHLALMAVLLAEHSRQAIDLLTVLQMLLVHDLVEIDAGDTFVYDDVALQDKAQREQKAAERLFGLLPPDQGQHLRALWDEFEAGRTPEAKFANALDRTLPVLQNYLTDGGPWRTHRVTDQQVRDKNRPIARGAPLIWQHVQQLIEQAVKQGQLKASGPQPPPGQGQDAH